MKKEEGGGNDLDRDVPLVDDPKIPDELCDDQPLVWPCRRQCEDEGGGKHRDRDDHD